MIRNRFFEDNSTIPLFYQIWTRIDVKMKTGTGKYNKIELNSELISKLLIFFMLGGCLGDLTPFSLSREDNTKGGTFTWCGSDRKTAAVVDVDNFMGEGQPEAGSFVF